MATKEKSEKEIQADADKARAEAAAAAAKSAKDSFAAPVTAKTVLTDSGTEITGKVITGRKTNLSAKEQGQLARGEIDEAGDPTGKVMKPKKNSALGGVRTSAPTETLYRGKISAEAIAAATGEKVSVVFEQVEPTTEDGLFYHFQQYHPSAKRDSFKIDPTNRIDPTLRTHLE